MGPQNPHVGGAGKVTRDDLDTYRVMLGPHVVYTDGSLPDTGKWQLNLVDLKGWRGRAADGTEVTPHWSGRGQVASSPSTPGRQITIEAELWGAVEEGLDVLGRMPSTTLIVAEDDRAMVRQADVRVTQMLESRIMRDQYLLTVSLTADDPLRYSAESRRLVNGANLLPNRGGEIAFGRLSLTGPHGAITITHPGGVWTFPALATGSRQIDFGELEVWNGNTRVFGAAAGPAPRVLPGGSSWIISGLGAGSATTTRCEAWS